MTVKFHWGEFSQTFFLVSIKVFTVWLSLCLRGLPFLRGRVNSFWGDVLDVLQSRVFRRRFQLRGITRWLGLGFGWRLCLRNRILLLTLGLRGDSLGRDSLGLRNQTLLLTLGLGGDSLGRDRNILFVNNLALGGRLCLKNWAIFWSLRFFGNYLGGNGIILLIGGAPCLTNRCLFWWCLLRGNFGFLGWGT